MKNSMNPLRLFALLAILLMPAALLAQSDSTARKNNLAIGLRPLIRWADSDQLDWFATIHYERKIKHRFSVEASVSSVKGVTPSYDGADGFRTIVDYPPIREPRYRYARHVLSGRLNCFLGRQSHRMSGVYVAPQASLSIATLRHLDDRLIGRGYATELNGIVGYQAIIRKRVSLDMGVAMINSFVLHNTQETDQKKYFYTLYIPIFINAGYVF